ncbi:DUF6147 family protein [Lederbergia sp. NSJ-179]|uniref:DUF6147 family protein n=1 Tax=Lederbergia sp. NSJ-179 TaxID=2931402 RepID=UPI001FD49DA1|nr:DUF6147 family protein [Lederbergia sp. NSJ-179]MCJ7840061.1 DUF6147 family protein [Lederbergia sp. NSJ-179]
MRKSRFIVLLFSAVLMVFLMSSPTLAAENDHASMIPTTGEASIDPNYGEGTIENSSFRLLANQYLANGKGIISRSGTTVTASANTTARTSVDVIGVRITLQKWDTQKGAWINLSNLGEYKSYGSSIVSGQQKVTVAKGRYRISCFHWVQKGSKVESASSISTYIEVK